MPSEHVPRPKNAFMFFRSHYNANPSEFLDPSVERHPDQNSVSCAAAAVWRSYSEAEKAPFREMALRERDRYAIEFPGYRYANGGVKKAKDRKKSVAVQVRRETTKRVRSAGCRMSISRRRVSIASTSFSERSPSPAASPALSEPVSPISSSSATPPPHTPSMALFTMPDLELAFDYHSDYQIGMEHESSLSVYDMQFVNVMDTSEDLAPEKPMWDTFEDRMFPSSSVYNAYPPLPPPKVQPQGLTFFNDTDLMIKLDE